jgi:NADH dehydrogenase
MAEAPRVVVVGAGFGGLAAARALRRAPAQVVVVDRENHHLFQPLLYQVATAGLSPADIASPTRSILARQRNTTVLLAEAEFIDLSQRRVVLDEGELEYDFLVLAAGAETNYFGCDGARGVAPGLKSLTDALDVRRRVLLAFETAEREGDPHVRRELLNFTVIGGGSTGVELAGALAELAHTVLARDFRSIDPTSAEVHLVEAGPRLLPGFDEKLSDCADRALGRLGVNVIVGERVAGVDAHGVNLEGGGHIVSATTIWAAGVRPVPLVTTLSGVTFDRAGRVVVERDLSIGGHPEAFVIGDLAAFEQDGVPLPGLAPVAMQEGQVAAANIERTIRGMPRVAFRYRDKGTMATIGRSRAVAELGGFSLTGFVAWIAWLVVHILYLIGFRNRAVVMFTWAWSYVTYKRGARIITGVPRPPTLAGVASPEIGPQRPESRVPEPTLHSPPS